MIGHTNCIFLRIQIVLVNAYELHFCENANCVTLQIQIVLLQIQIVLLYKKQQICMTNWQLHIDANSSWLWQKGHLYHKTFDCLDWLIRVWYMGDEFKTIVIVASMPSKFDQKGSAVPLYCTVDEKGWEHSNTIIVNICIRFEFTPRLINASQLRMYTFK